MTIGVIKTWGKEQTPIEVERVGWYNSLGTDGPIKVPLFDESGLNWIVASMREQIIDGFDCPFVVSGNRRMGKSVFTLKLSLLHCKNFKENDVHFDIEPFMAGLESKSEADPRIGYFPMVDFDEGITGLHNQEWQSQVPYVKVLNIIGKKMITMAIVLPHISDLNPKVTRMMMMWVYIPERGIAEIRLPKTNQFNRDIFWVPYCAIKYDMFPLGHPFWARYTERKDVFISDYTKKMSEVEGPGGKAGRYSDQRNKLIEYITENKWAQYKDIAELLEVKQNTVSMWMARKKQGQVI